MGGSFAASKEVCMSAKGQVCVGQWEVGKLERRNAVECKMRKMFLRAGEENERACLKT
jgi:hypothetical protein